MDEDNYGTSPVLGPEADDDLFGALLSKFDQTTVADPDDLVKQWSAIMSVDPSEARFFLESANFDLGTAIALYLEAHTREPISPPHGFPASSSSSSSSAFAPIPAFAFGSGGGQLLGFPAFAGGFASGAAAAPPVSAPAQSQAAATASVAAVSAMPTAGVAAFPMGLPAAGQAGVPPPPPSAPSSSSSSSEMDEL